MHQPAAGLSLDSEKQFETQRTKDAEIRVISLFSIN